VLVGSASGVNVWYDPGSPDGCKQNAVDLLADMPRLVAFNSKVFGHSGNADVIVWAIQGLTSGNGGGSHGGCTFKTGGAIEVCQATGLSPRVSALFLSEFSECCMGGHLCGFATGETLSRWVAMAGTNNALANFNTTAALWQENGCPNWVDTVNMSDKDFVAIGCGMAFLSWLMAKQGKTLPTLARAMVHNGDTGTLAQLYGPNAWHDFMADVKALPTPIVDDNPFNAPLAA
jgi:hypothetical protein